MDNVNREGGIDRAHEYHPEGFGSRFQGDPMLTLSD
jgi:hypothetical protein